jgi:hypothetical protein
MAIRSSATRMVRLIELRSGATFVDVMFALCAWVVSVNDIPTMPLD